MPTTSNCKLQRQYRYFLSRDKIIFRLKYQSKVHPDKTYYGSMQFFIKFFITLCILCIVSSRKPFVYHRQYNQSTTTAVHVNPGTRAGRAIIISQIPVLKPHPYASPSPGAGLLHCVLQSHIKWLCFRRTMEHCSRSPISSPYPYGISVAGRIRSAHLSPMGLCSGGHTFTMKTNIRAYTP